MAADNILRSTKTVKNSLAFLKKRLSDLKVEVESFDSSLEQIDTKIDNLIVQTEIYKSKLEREMGREVRRLERELTLLRKKSGTVPEVFEATDNELKVASSVAIIESVLRLICNGAEDFRLMSEAFLFPAVIERIMEGTEDAYFLEEVPTAAATVISRGREYIEWVREEYDTHLTDPETWDSAIDYITEWWRNDALPLLYGSRDEQWDIDMPLSLAEMLTWRDIPAERPITYSAIFDAYEIYRKHKDLVYERTALRQFELKHFTF